MTWGLFGADVDKTAFFLSFAGVCGCLLPMFCAFALAGFDIKSVKQRREQTNNRCWGVHRQEEWGAFFCSNAVPSRSFEVVLHKKTLPTKKSATIFLCFHRFRAEFAVLYRCEPALLLSCTKNRNFCVDRRKRAEATLRAVIYGRDKVAG